ncbi:MAG: PD40 domain-containing protein [Anaerolineae bacterium]|nr:PD40 domain-containing protein [Anaerolineae bacterium]
MILRLAWRTSTLLSVLLLIASIGAISLGHSNTEAVLARYSLNDVFVQGIDEDANIYIHDLTTDLRVPLTADGTRNFGFIDTPDGQHILFISDDCQGQFGLCQMDLDGHNKRLLADNLPRNAAPGTGASWSPDGTRLAFVSPSASNVRQPALYVFDYLASQLHEVPTPLYMDWDAPLIWERDSKTLTFVVAQPRVFVGYRFDVENGDRPQAIHTWLQGTWNARSNILDAFGTIFVVKSQEALEGQFDLYLLDLASGASSNLSNTPLTNESDANFAENSTTLAVISELGDAQMLSVISADWARWQMVAVDGASLAFPSWIKNDSAILYYHGTTNAFRACVASMETYESECPLMWAPNIVFLDAGG